MHIIIVPPGHPLLHNILIPKVTIRLIRLLSHPILLLYVLLNILLKLLLVELQVRVLFLLSFSAFLVAD